MNLQKEAESYVLEHADRLQSLARNEVTEAQERAHTVNTHKDEMTEEQNVAMNKLQYKVQQMEMNELHHREEAQQQFLRMQKVYDEQQAMLQEQLSTKYDAMFAESERRYEAKISHAACSLQAAVEENRSLKVKMVDEHFLLLAARDESSITSPASREGCAAEDEEIKQSLTKRLARSFGFFACRNTTL